MHQNAGRRIGQEARPVNRRIIFYENSEITKMKIWVNYDPVATKNEPNKA